MFGELLTDIVTKGGVNNSAGGRYPLGDSLLFLTMPLALTLIIAIQWSQLSFAGIFLDDQGVRKRNWIGQVTAIPYSQITRHAITPSSQNELALVDLGNIYLIQSADQRIRVPHSLINFEDFVTEFEQRLATSTTE